jgi:hypothetical protein
MKRVAILIVLAGVVGWGGAAFASKALPPIRWEGDPDEFQAKRVLDVDGLRLGSGARQFRTAGKVGDDARRRAPALPGRVVMAGRTRISVTLGGRTFLWEK